MEHFDFERVYEECAKPLDNRPVPTNPFGPILVKALLEEDGVFIIGHLPPAAMLPFFISDEGAEHLEQLIDQMLSKQVENFCIIKVHECHMKTVASGTDEALEAMKEKRLNGDPEATHCIALFIYHKSGTRVGCLPIDSERVSHYRPLLGEDVKFINVKADANPLH